MFSPTRWAILGERLARGEDPVDCNKVAKGRLFTRVQAWTEWIHSSVSLEGLLLGSCNNVCLSWFPSKSSSNWTRYKACANSSCKCNFTKCMLLVRLSLEEDYAPVQRPSPVCYSVNQLKMKRVGWQEVKRGFIAVVLVAIYLKASN